MDALQYIREQLEALDVPDDVDGALDDWLENCDSESYGRYQAYQDALKAITPMTGVYVVFVRENIEPVIGAFSTEEKALALVEAIGNDTAEMSFEPIVENDRDLADAIGAQYDITL